MAGGVADRGISGEGCVAWGDSGSRDDDVMWKGDPVR
jgi:hypothetical protein